MRNQTKPIYAAISILIIAVTTFIALEISARVFWKIKYRLPLSKPDKVLNAFYPELTEFDWRYEELTSNEDALDILLLGGSVLNRYWGTIEQDLREQLTAQLKRPVRIYNMAEIGHTSRDSYLKYVVLEEQQFDLIIFYHGINESRANNVPADLFKDDYSHYSWYETVNMLKEYHNRSFLALPYTLKLLYVQLKEKLETVRYVSMDGPRKDWIKFGENVKSASSFKKNLQALIAMADTRNETILLMTFATHLPENYSQKLFNAQALDYSLHLSYVELWGNPTHVKKAVDRHNDVIRGIKQQYDHLLFVDQAKLMPKSQRYFNDICHLTAKGSTIFNDNMIEKIVHVLKK